jgi:two-component system, NarL family, response regulator NreC
MQQSVEPDGRAAGTRTAREEASGTIRLLLADDHPMLRSGLRALLAQQRDFAVVAEARDGQEAIDKSLAYRPDVVVMDISMPRVDGLEATREITSRLPDTRVLVLTGYDEAEYLLLVLQAGGSGYVRKQAADRELVDAIRRVHRGEVFLYPSGVKLVLEALAHHPHVAEAHTRGELSERELDVLRLTAEGYTGPEVAARLYLSPKTVDTYRQRIMERLHLHHRSQLVHYALEAGLLKP